MGTRIELVCLGRGSAGCRECPAFDGTVNARGSCRLGRVECGLPLPERQLPIVWTTSEPDGKPAVRENRTGALANSDPQKTVREHVFEFSRLLAAD